MKRTYSLYFILVVLIFSCNKEESISGCHVENPIEELEWLQDVKNSLTNCSCQISIMQGMYKGRTVYYSLMNDPLCNSSFNVILWDCNGSVVKEYSNNELNLFGAEVQHEKTLFVCKN